MREFFEEILDRLGQMPLPPYITHRLKDKNRYQTVYAKYDGSAAAPTAGLHFTPELLQTIREKGVHIAEVTLHVGLGTFRPVKVENVSEHHMHSEFYMIDEKGAGYDQCRKTCRRTDHMCRDDKLSDIGIGRKKKMARSSRPVAGRIFLFIRGIVLRYWIH